MTSAAGCFVCCSATGWCCFWIHRYNLETMQFHTMVLKDVLYVAVSHDGAAGSSNTLILAAVSHDDAA